MAETYARLLPGDPAPWFRQVALSNPSYVFDIAAGRYIMLCFVGSGADSHAQAAITAVKARPDLFDDTNASFFAVTGDPTDREAGRVSDKIPGYRNFIDTDFTIARLYGSAPQEGPVDRGSLRRFWMLLSPDLRIIWMQSFKSDRSDIDEAIATLEAQPPVGQTAGFEVSAPVLILPQVFEPEFCTQLIDLYRAKGGESSGFMREIDGRTVGVNDARHKVRADLTIDDEALQAQLRARFARRIVPQIAKAYQFNVTRMERFLVACYDAADGGHFRAHRDNTTKGTAHRRFAVSVNLNNDFEGGEVGFPEYGPRRYKPPAGGAVVFSCSLLHSVSAVTRGARYAFLPFLYDDAAAAVRQQNMEFLDLASKPNSIGATPQA